MELYRLEDELQPGGVVIRLLRFTVLRETPSGYWIAPIFMERVVRFCLEQGRTMRQLKPYNVRFVTRSPSGTRGKRYAYEQYQDAVYSFGARKAWQAKRAATTLGIARKCQEAYGLLKDLTPETFTERQVLGHTDETEQLAFY